jgi:hypothetical protein
VSAPVHTIERKAELAMKHALDGVTPLILTGFAGEDVRTPCLGVFAPRSEPEAIGDTLTGNHVITLTVSVLTSADDETAGAHDTLAGAVRDILMQTPQDVVDDLNGAGQDMTAFDWTIGETRREARVDGRLNVTEIDGALYAAPSSTED